MRSLNPASGNARTIPRVSFLPGGSTEFCDTAIRLCDIPESATVSSSSSEIALAHSDVCERRCEYLFASFEPICAAVISLATTKMLSWWMILTWCLSSVCRAIRKTGPINWCHQREAPSRDYKNLPLAERLHVKRTGVIHDNPIYPVLKRNLAETTGLSSTCFESDWGNPFVNTPAIFSHQY